MRVWRIASAGHAAFDGEGARRYGSRWTPRGRPAVFTSATLSLAALERFVNADPDLEVANLVALAVDIDPSVSIHRIGADDLPRDWRTYPTPPGLATIGEEWLTARAAGILSVPSVVIPHERNFVLNPAHPAFASLTIHRPEPFSFDPRMWNKRRAH